MIERLLIGLLAPRLDNQTENDDIVVNAILPGIPISPYKFHMGMLGVSLIIGLGYGGFVTYSCWIKENIFQTYIRNLVITLVVRTFFSMLFDGVAVLGWPARIGGSNTLSAFECICLNLVVAYWLLLTIYLWARLERNMNNEPNMFLYQIFVPGIAVFFALVWIFAMEGQGAFHWWILDYWSTLPQWIVNSQRLLYLLIQLGLLADMARTMTKESSFDNDSISIIRKMAAVVAVLVFLFWLHFGLCVGRPSLYNPDPYLYFYHLVDGLQCAMLCPIFFFFEKWVRVGLDKKYDPSQRTSLEFTVPGKRSHSIVTVDSILMTREKEKKWNEDQFAESKDVVYSSVVQPEQLKKTLELYKRLDIIPDANQATVIEGDKFYDCDFQHKDMKAPKRIGNDAELQDDKAPKRNAFYSSKYLIVDPKPKYSHKNYKTQLSVSSVENEKLRGEKPRRFPGHSSQGNKFTDSNKQPENDKKRFNEIEVDEMSDFRYESKKLPYHRKDDIGHKHIDENHGKEPETRKTEPIILKPISSSDSEFEAEKSKRFTPSSDSSFSLDEYYSKIMTNKDKVIGS